MFKYLICYIVVKLHEKKNKIIDINIKFDSVCIKKIEFQYKISID